MKKFIYIALAIFTLTACSNEDDLSKGASNKKEIGFKTFVGTNTRAGQGFCSGNMPLSLSVYASVPDGTGYKPYFEDKEFDYDLVNDDGSYRCNDGLYWPDSNVRFFSVYGASPHWTSDGSTMEFDFNCRTDVNHQEDLIYAASGDVQGVNYDGSYYASLFFRHALSQIEFKAKTDDDEFYVEVVGLSINNVMGSGHYVLPVKTDNYYTAHATFEGNNYRTTRGTWSNLKNSTNYRVDLNPVVHFVKSDGTVSLTEEDTGTWEADYDGPITGAGKPKECNVNTLNLIPQDARSTGKIVLILNVWKMADPSKGIQDTDELLPVDEIEFSIPNVWEEGKHYIYTLVVHGGDEKIRFSINVDDYDISSNEVVTY